MLRFAMMTLLLSVSCSEYDVIGFDTDVDVILDTEIIDSGDTEVIINGPVALCGTTHDEVEPPHTEVTFTDAGSYDSDGGTIISKEWVMVQSPAGTSIPLSATGDNYRFTPDMVGGYVAELTVTDNDGLTDSCNARVNAVPGEDLWIELFWDVEGEDMDLHLLAPAGTLESYYDCYYANCTNFFGFGLDWGVPNFTDDDPILDLDDINFTGPENINIEEPEDGVYTVVVHDYNWSNNYGSSFATINIYIGGQLLFNDTREFTGEGTYVYYATIDMHLGTINTL